MNKEIDRAPLISRKNTFKYKLIVFSSIIQLFLILHKRIVKGNQVIAGHLQAPFFERQCSYGVTEIMHLSM